MNAAELTGQVRTHVSDVQNPPCSLHDHVVAPFLNMRRAAALAGIDLVPVSAFRDFPRQLRIWNDKFSGQKPMLDASGTIIDAASLSPESRVESILLWSALPGASRHHWGTDLDFIDANADAAAYPDKLTRRAFAPAGPFAGLAEWLEANATRFGFFRPYKGVRSGVQPEPWHFSFAPVAELARRRLGADVLRAAIESAPLLGKDEVLLRLDDIHARYVASIDLP